MEYSTKVYAASFNSTSSPIDNIEVDDEFLRLATIVKSAAPPLFSILLFTGLIANILVIYVTLVTNRTTKHPVHSIFVLNLAAADILYLLSAGPYSVIILTVSQWRYGSFLCSMIPFLATASITSSIYTICILACIRFMALIMPFRFRTSCMSKRKAGCCIVFGIWMGGCVLAMPYLIFFGLEDIKKNGQLSCGWLSTMHSYNIFVMVQQAVNYFIPMVLVIFFYTVVMKQVLCYMILRNSVTNQGQMEEKKDCVKSTIVVLTLILAFLICWFPHLLNAVLTTTGHQYVKGDARNELLFQVVGKSLAYTHAIVNPIIYTFASPIFRRSLQSSLRENVQKCRRGSRCLAGPKSGNGSKRGSDNIELDKLNSTRNLPTKMLPVTENDNEEVVTPKTEQIPMLAVDSHETEITRLPSPDLSLDRHDETSYCSPSDRNA